MDPEAEDLRAKGLDPDDYAILLQPAAGLQLDPVMIPGVGPALQIAAVLVVPESVLRIPQTGMLDANGQPVPSKEAREAVPGIAPVVRLCIKRTILAPTLRDELAQQVATSRLDLGALGRE